MCAQRGSPASKYSTVQYCTDSLIRSSRSERINRGQVWYKVLRSGCRWLSSQDRPPGTSAEGGLAGWKLESGRSTAQYKQLELAVAIPHRATSYVVLKTWETGRRLPGVVYWGMMYQVSSTRQYRGWEEVLSIRK